MIPSQRLFVLFALLSVGAQAQWLNYPTPGIPRTRDGKPNLTAPAPRTAEGKPDLSGVWHVQPTSLAEMKRIYGDGVAASSVPGMEPDTISKYALNILLDFKPEDSPIRPEGLAILRARPLGGNPGDRCLPLGIPVNGLVSEPNRDRAVASDDRHHVRIRRHASPDLHRRPASFPSKLHNRPGSAIPPANGNATRWWLKRPASTTKPGWIYPVTRTAKRCASWSAIIAATSDTWMLK